jgi:hypothetical protein
VFRPELETRLLPYFCNLDAMSEEFGCNFLGRTCRLREVRREVIMNNGPRFSAIEYISLFLLVSSCAYIFVPEVRVWVHHHLVTFLAMR